MRMLWGGASASSQYEGGFVIREWIHRTAEDI